MYVRRLIRKATLCGFRPGRLAGGPHEGAWKAGALFLQSESCSSSRGAAVRCSSWRPYATRSAADGYLVELLKTEIEQENHRHRQEEAEGKVGSVGPFELTDNPGTEDVVLSRTVGSEKIEILCMLEKQYPEEEDEEEEQKLQHNHYHHYNKKKNVVDEEGEEQVVEVLHLSVTMSKGEVSMELDCSFVRGASEVMIEFVLFHESDATLSAGQPQPYGGPIFEDLDENLQRAFHELLKARGLSARVARYMMDYMSGKEHREYIRWLHKLKAFFTF